MRKSAGNICGQKEKWDESFMDKKGGRNVLGILVQKSFLSKPAVFILLLLV
jgi:hypothetical protein